MEQENLIASEIRYRRLFESSKDGILILDAETGAILDVNPFLIDLLDFPLEQFIGKAIWDIGFFKDIAANRDKFSELQQKRYVRYENLPLETARGRRINVEFVSNVYLEGNDKVIQCNIRDITERKLIEAELSNIHWRMETIIGATQIGTWEWNVQTGETIFNEEWAIMIGYTLDELMPTNYDTWVRFVHPDDLKESNKQMERHFAGEIPFYECECRMKHKNGSWVWVLDHGCVINRSSDGLPYMVFGAHTNINGRKLAEEKLKLSEIKTQALLDAIHDLMFRLNSQGIYIDYKATKDDLVYQAQTIIGKKNRDIMPPEFADLIDEKIKITLQSGQMQVFNYQLDVPARGLLDFEARMVCCCREDVIAIVRDITERKKSEEVIAQKTEALQKLNAEKDKYFSIIAHDLRSPFNGFLGLTQLMAEDLSDMTLVEIQRIALSMRKSAINLYGLLENLLEWSCLQRGVTGYAPSNISLLSKISESLPSVMESAIKKKINILFSVPEHLMVFADANMLASSMRNLVSNAVKFTPKGGVVTISAMRAENNFVEISIKDTGIGMDKNMLDNLFHLDEQTNRKGTEGEQSTGLGLILCQGFIEKHGGILSVESEEGNGSTFRFTLPAAN